MESKSFEGAEKEKYLEYDLPPPSYTYATNDTVPFLHDTPYEVNNEPKALPNDHLLYSIFTTVCCCWIIGIFAILSSAECRAAVASGNMALAQSLSKKARRLAHLSLILGILFMFIIVALQFGYYSLVVEPMMNHLSSGTNTIDR